jgi:hypothetical protein
MKKTHISTIIRENKTLFIILAVGLFLLELEIFAVAAGKSGTTSWVRVQNEKGNLIHETRGNRLPDTDRIYIEKTFGPIGRFDVRLIRQEVPFPFRAWFVAAVGIPVAVILLFGFIVSAYSSLFYAGEKRPENHGTPEGCAGTDTRLDRILSRISRYNIYTIGFLVFLSVFAYWVVPNFITFLGKLGIETLSRYKWFFMALSGVFLGLGIWIIYLRYLLAKRAMDQHLETEKFRLELEYTARTRPFAQVGYDGENTREVSPRSLNAH